MIGDFTRRVDVLQPIGSHQGATGTPFDPCFGSFCQSCPSWPPDPQRSATKIPLARIIQELVLRDCEDGRTTGQPQGLESEAYLNSTSQGSRPEDARKDVYIRGPPEADS